MVPDGENLQLRHAGRAPRDPESRLLQHGRVVLVLGGGLAANWRLVRLVIASYTTSPVIDPVPLPLPDKPSLVVLPFVNLRGAGLGGAL